MKSDHQDSQKEISIEKISVMHDEQQHNLLQVAKTTTTTVITNVSHLYGSLKLAWLLLC